jgi:hypothetical protein
MTTIHKAADHHAEAATHHAQAAHFHREASRHYQVGKDYAHAAHQALTAHGHALRAMAHGQAARESYAAQEGSPLPSYLTRAPAQPASMAVAAPAILDGPAHHAVAATHHEAARLHHKQAGTHAAAEHYVRAYHETKYALSHGTHGIFHADQAALHQLDQDTYPAAVLV